MKSIKPGRGPSMMGAISSFAMALFGVFWTIITVAMGAGFMAIFGIIFIFLAVVQGIYQLKNATSPNRMSAFDITEQDEEIDPLNERFGKMNAQDKPNPTTSAKFCPYCGTSAEHDFIYCKKCGKKLP